MGKRSNFERRKRDFYPTPLAAVQPLIPHLRGIHTFAEPCRGDGRLVRHLESVGLIYVYSGDIATGQDALARDDYAAPDVIATNPPFNHQLLHQLISHFVKIAPTWLLLEMGFATNKRDAVLLACCTDVVPIGRVRWIEGSKDYQYGEFRLVSFPARPPRRAAAPACGGLRSSRPVTDGIARMRNAAGLITRPDQIRAFARRPAGNAPTVNALAVTHP